MAKLPTLSSSGWVNDIVIVSTTLMDYFLTSDYSQTQFYPGEVASMPYIVQQTGSEPKDLERMAQSALERLYGRYFDRVAISASSDNLNSPDGRYNLTLDVAVVSNGEQHRLGRMLRIGDSKIIQITDPNAD